MIVQAYVVQKKVQLIKIASKSQYLSACRSQVKINVFYIAVQ